MRKPDIKEGSEAKTEELTQRLASTGRAPSRKTQPNDAPTGMFNPAKGKPVSRRTLGMIQGATPEMLRGQGALNPLAVLTILPEIHPMVGQAVWNVLRLACDPDDLTFKALDYPESGEGDASINPKGTNALHEFWENGIPEEYGGLGGVFSTLMLTTLLTGMTCMEAVPARRGQGIAAIHPVDTLTIAFARDTPLGPIVPYQKQKGKLDGWQRLDPLTFFWRSIDMYPDDPYGRAPYAPVISEVLADMALIRDLRDSIRQSAWPRMRFGFNFQEMYKVAKDVFNIVDAQKAASWVKERFDEATVAAKNMYADDVLLYDASGAADVINGGDFTKLESIIRFLRQRITQALKSLPTLMGVNDGGTQTYTTVEWAIFAKGIQTLREIAAAPLLKAAQLHLRLLGIDSTVELSFTPIKTGDDYVHEMTVTQRILNLVAMRDQGWMSQEAASIQATGSGPEGPAPEPEVRPGSNGSSLQKLGKDTPRADKQQKENDSAPPDQSGGGEQGNT